MARKSVHEIEQRRSEVRELMLMGWKDKDIMAKLTISRDILDGDKDAISSEYLKEITSDSSMYQKQAEHILKHLDQLDMIKKKLWTLESTAQSEKGQIEALRTLLTELEHESKILRLIDTNKTIIKNYIHVDKINVLMTKITDVIREFVPVDKQGSAFSRLKGLGEVLENGSEKIIDVDSEREDNEKD